MTLNNFDTQLQDPIGIKSVNESPRCSLQTPSPTDPKSKSIFPLTLYINLTVTTHTKNDNSNGLLLLRKHQIRSLAQLARRCSHIFVSLSELQESIRDKLWTYGKDTQGRSEDNSGKDEGAFGG